MRRALCILCLSLLLAFCACTAPEQTPQPNDTVTDAGMITVTPPPTQHENAEAAKPTPGFSINPVSAFYALYALDTDSALQAYRATLMTQSTVGDIKTLLDFNEHCAAVTRPNVSIGRLCASGGVYADTLLGAAAGSGILTPQSSADLKLANEQTVSGSDEDSTENLHASADDFTFTFSYNEGYRMRGYLKADLLYYAVFPIYSNQIITQDIDEETGHEADIVTTQTETGDFLYSCYLKRSLGAHWTSLVLRADRVSMLTLQNMQLTFETKKHDEAQFSELQTLSCDMLCAYMQTGVIGSDGQVP